MAKNVSGKRIKEQRISRGWDQVELAAALSVDWEVSLEPSDISEIERGVRGVKDFELRAFAKVFGVSADWLLGDVLND